jgi:hypothetical protein
MRRRGLLELHHALAQRYDIEGFSHYSSNIVPSIPGVTR